MSAKLTRVIDHYQKRGSPPRLAAVRLATALLRSQELPDTFHNRCRVVCRVEPTGYPSYEQLRAFLASPEASLCAS